MPTRLALLLLSALLLPACSLSRMANHAVETQARRHGLEERRAVFGGRQVTYWVGGSGPPLVLLHGFGGNGLWTWARQLRELSDQHTLIVPDLLWFGDSHGLGLAPTLDAQARTIADLIAHEGHDSAHLMGVSYGGFVALQLHHDAPERVDRVVIVDSPGPVFDAADRAAMLERLGVEDPREFFIPTEPEDVGRLLSVVRPGGPAIPRFVLEDVRRAWFRGDLDARRTLMTDLVSREAPGPEQILRLPEELLIVWGEEDPVFPLEVGEEFAAAAGAPLVVIAGAAHGPNFQHPRPFNAAVASFLRGEDPVAELGP